MGALTALWNGLWAKNISILTLRKEQLRSILSICVDYCDSALYREAEKERDQQRLR